MKKGTVLVSGGFDPMHVGHLRMFQDASRFGDVIVAINSDDWLMRKKGFVFMPWDERFEMIIALDCVSQVISFNDDDGTAIDAITKAKPTYFANGGDRVSHNTPEGNACDALGVEMLWNIGGSKARSSSGLVASAIPREKRPWGEFQVLYEQPTHKVKKLIIKPGGNLSLQSHEHRSELWKVVAGSADVTVGVNKKPFKVNVNESVTIPDNTIHRCANTGDVDLEIIEVQFGTYLGEDDIFRYDDDYGRL